MKLHCWKLHWFWVGNKFVQQNLVGHRSTVETLNTTKELTVPRCDNWRARKRSKLVGPSQTQGNVWEKESVKPVGVGKGMWKGWGTKQWFGVVGVWDDKEDGDVGR